jgi:hypothetical protein
MPTETLAHKLGTTTHLSPLLMKARRLGLRTPEDLCALAVKRGCRYYDMHGDSSRVQEGFPLRVSCEEFSNTELAIALLSLFPPVTLLRQRIGAAMLSADDVDVSDLASLAEAEQCGETVHYIADCGHQVEPENEFWIELRSALSSHRYDVEKMPHPTRFIEMTGITRGKVGIQKHWVRPPRTPSLEV